jgi:beta-xylosidase
MLPSTFRPLASALATLLAGAAATARPSEPVLAWGDQGDGTYRNPILPADYSDPDVIRVGEDFYLVASDFHFVGIQVLHSRDLVNWEIIGQVFHRLPMAAKYDEMRGYAEGPWAPSLRYHAGRFHLYACTPHDGLFLWTARDPGGPWSDAVTVKAVDRWEDPCPFWDDDRQAYLVHSVHGAGPLVLHRLSADGTQLLDAGVEIYRGPVAEGPKLFKRHGWYYISLPEGGVERGGQTILRSRALYGPYARREVLPPGSPHQGGLVELPDGDAWFIGFKSAGWLGRVCHLLPVRWEADGWPVFGQRGQPVLAGVKPALGRPAHIRHPAVSDAFDGPLLAPQWQWNHNPVDAAWSLTRRPGWLRLQALPAAELAVARNTLTQKLWGDSGTYEVTLDPQGLGEGQRAGLAFMSGREFHSIGIVRSQGELTLFADATPGPAIAPGPVRLRAAYQVGTGELAYTGSEGGPVPLLRQITLKFSQWKGARIALFAYGAGEGIADFDAFTFTPGAPAGPGSR